MNGLNFPSGRLFDMLNESSQRRSELHRLFLRGRQSSMDGVRALIELQMNNSQPGSAPNRENTAQVSLPQVSEQPRAALFDSRHLDAFGRGQMARCFGPEYAKYDGRRIPRIPNGDFKMMSRVVSIEGSRRDFQRPSSIVVEYDVPSNAWYLRDNITSEIPASLYMEIALQPCGFLSAYLDTYTLVPHRDYFFRNLDGSLVAVNPMDVRGKTITTHARLLTSVASGGTVIQKFTYALSCAGTIIYTGEATFGYFAVETMINQVGLDGGRRVLPLMQADPAKTEALSWLDLHRLQQGTNGQNSARLPRERMHLIDCAAASRSGGQYGKGYLFASRPVNPQDWFYPFHFYQDPVMPGSLGVEAVLETMQAGALAWGLEAELHLPSFRMLSGTLPMTWRYRGQITPQHGLMELEVHLSAVERLGAEVRLTGDASVWVDGLRIYEINNATVSIAASQVLEI